jgi:hypothetical protein
MLLTTKFWCKYCNQCFGSESGTGSAFDGRLDPDPEPGGLKGAKIKRKTQAKDSY